MSHGPVEEQHRALMSEMGKLLNKVFDGYGFCLLVFEHGEGEGRMNYLSNARREDMITAMKEFIANAEGRALEPPKSGQ